MKIDELIKKADAGDPSAQVELAIRYEDGDGIAVDKDKAFKYYKLAADQNDAKGINCLGLCYELGIGVAIDANKSFELYKKSAEMGYMAAQNNLGLSYLNGFGCEVNKELAFKYYKLAADKGYAMAQTNLGKFYLQDDTYNPKLAFKYIKLAADQNNEDAISLLGECYFFGIGVEKDEKKAYKLWYSLILSCKNDDILAIAKYYVGYCLENGYGCKKDTYLGFVYHKEAAKLKYTQSYIEIGRYYLFNISRLVHKNYNLAFKWFKKALDEGDTDDYLYYFLGLCYQNGYGTKVDYNEAIKFYKLALEQNFDCQDEYNQCLEALNNDEVKTSKSSNKKSTSSDKKVVSNEPKKDPEEELNKLIGLASVKRELNRIKAFIKKNRGKPLNIHMAFTGNPGTGKTVVARLLAQIFQKYGALPPSNDPLVETDRDGLVGQYIGETGKKTHAKVQEAMGKVLFIDEAYSLAGGGKDDNKDFGKEAINALIKDMEDLRGKFCVILAGYTNEMKELISLNPGFKSRIKYIIEFPNYNRDELKQIAQLMLKNSLSEAYTMDEAALEKLLDIIDKVKDQKDFANARTVRVALEKIEYIQNERTQDDIADRKIIIDDVNLFEKEYLNEMLNNN